MNELQDLLLGYWRGFVDLLPQLVIALVLLAVVWWGSGWLRARLDRQLCKKYEDPLLAQFITKIARWVVGFLGVLLSLQIIGLSGVVAGITAGAGVSAIIVGFAFKDIAENFLAGAILAFSRPFNLGDTITIENETGTARELSLRITRIKTPEGKDVFLPNSMVLKQKVVNHTFDGFLRQDFVVGIDFEDDVTEATQLILAELRQIPEILGEPPHAPLIVVKELAASSVNLKVMFWTAIDDDRRNILEVLSAAMDRVKTVLAANGFSLPPDILEVRLPGSPKQLPSASPPATATATATATVAGSAKHHEPATEGDAAANNKPA